MACFHPDSTERTSESQVLLRQGFTPFETMRLMALKSRYERGAVKHTIPGCRLQFARWLVHNGRLAESVSASGHRRAGLPSHAPDARVGSPALSDVTDAAADPRGDQLGAPVDTGAASRCTGPCTEGHPGRMAWPHASSETRRNVTRSQAAATLLFLLLLSLAAIQVLSATFAM